MDVELITRRKNYYEDKVWFHTNSFKSGDNWFNTIYINFCKDDYPNLKYPELINGFREGEKRFDYSNCDLANLDWHCGLTFYEETLLLETGKTYIKAGADYQHIYDDDYMKKDCGEAILMSSEGLIGQFRELVKSKQPHQNTEQIKEGRDGD